MPSRYAYDGFNYPRLMFDFGFTSIKVTTVTDLYVEGDTRSARIVEMRDTKCRTWTLAECFDGTMMPVEVWRHGFEGDRDMEWALDPRIPCEEGPFEPAYLIRPPSQDMLLWHRLADEEADRLAEEEERRLAEGA